MLEYDLGSQPKKVTFVRAIPTTGSLRVIHLFFRMGPYFVHGGVCLVLCKPGHVSTSLVIRCTLIFCGRRMYGGTGTACATEVYTFLKFSRHSGKNNLWARELYGLNEVRLDGGGCWLQSARRQEKCVVASTPYTRTAVVRA